MYICFKFVPIEFLEASRMERFTKRRYTFELELELPGKEEVEQEEEEEGEVMYVQVCSAWPIS